MFKVISASVIFAILGYVVGLIDADHRIWKEIRLYGDNKEEDNMK